ncbi:unnamed protein product, partial [Ectocarpus sp. 8 AP-2014]
TSIAQGRDGEDRLVKAICDRFRGVADFDRRVMKKIFSLSVCSDSVLALLDEVMVLNTKTKKGDVERELRVEFVLMFFDILVNMVKRGESSSDLGYVVAGATPEDMSNARATLEKHAALLADRYGACFRLKSFKIPRPRLAIGCKHVDFDVATADTLNNCLSTDDAKTRSRSRGEFLDVVFAIISQSHKTPCETYAGMKTDAAKTFFLESILDSG